MNAALPLQAGLPTGQPAASVNGLAADARSLDRLKYAAGRDGKTGVREAARQLESLFMRELIKSMRDATMKSGLTDSGQSDVATDLFDQQMAVQMSGLQGGLASAIERQLSGAMGGNAAGDAARSAPPTGAVPGTGREAPRPWVRALQKQSAEAVRMPNAADTLRGPASSPSSAAPGDAEAAKQRFVGSLQGAAARAARSSGIPASFMLGQAALETGWGRREIRQADGSPSFNLFGIKADANWQGKVAEVTTTEYVNGQPRRMVARFRAYDSYEQSFEDYARLINNSPRYAAARSQMHSAQAFADGLQRAGYATDPFYASKLGRTIEAALRVQRLTV